MDVRFINAFLDGTVDVLKMMAFVDPKAGKAYLRKDGMAKGDVSGVIGLIHHNGERGYFEAFGWQDIEAQKPLPKDALFRLQSMTKPVIAACAMALYDAGKFTLDEIGIPGGIGKSLDDYDNDDAQVRGAKYANMHLRTEFGKGSKPKRVYIRTVTAKYPKTDVLCYEYADQVPPEFVVDREIMLEKTIKQPISRIIEALGWDWNDVDPSRTTLAQWGFG